MIVWKWVSEMLHAQRGASVAPPLKAPSGLIESWTASSQRDDEAAMELRELFKHTEEERRNELRTDENRRCRQK